MPRAALATFALLIASVGYAADDAPNPAPRDTASGLPTGKRQHKPAYAVPAESTAEKAARKLATRPQQEEGRPAKVRSSASVPAKD